MVAEGCTADSQMEKVTKRKPGLREGHGASLEGREGSKRWKRNL